MPSSTEGNGVRLVAGLLNTDAMNFVDCPECYQEAGKNCIARGGKRKAIPHDGRIHDFHERYPQFKHLYRGGLPDQVAVRKANEALHR